MFRLLAGTALVSLFFASLGGGAALAKPPPLCRTEAEQDELEVIIKRINGHYEYGLRESEKDLRSLKARRSVLIQKLPCDTKAEEGRSSILSDNPEPEKRYFVGDPLSKQRWEQQQERESWIKTWEEEQERRERQEIGAVPGFPRMGNGGFYAGVFGGGVSQNVTVGWFPNQPGFGDDTLPLALFHQTTIGNLGQAAFIGGGQVGYDTTISFDGGGTSVSLVIGFVADIAGTTGGSAHNAVFPSIGGGHFPIQSTFSSGFETTERGRVGVDFSVDDGWSATPYATGGFAAAQVNSSDSMNFFTSFNHGSRSEFRPAWTVGGGVDIKLAGAPFTIQAQYLHTDFGRDDYVLPNNVSPSSFIATGHTFTQDRATIGVNFNLDFYLQGSASGASLKVTPRDAARRRANQLQ